MSTDLDKAGKPKFFYGYIVVFSTLITVLLTWGTIYCFGVFLKPMLDEFGWTTAMASGAYSVFFFACGLLGIVAGRLTDSFGPRIVVTTCAFFLGLGYLLMSQINAGWQLYLLYGALIAIGASGAFVPALSTVSRWFVKRRGMMTGIVLAGIGLGTIIMPPIVRWLISGYGWRTSYIILGVMVLVSIIPVAQFLKRDPSKMELMPYGQNELKEGSPNLETGGLSLQQAIHTRQFWMLGVVFFAFMFCIQIIMVHIVVHTTGLGISAASAVSVLSTIGGLSIVGRIALGTISDRIGNKLALAISMALMSVALLWVIPGRELWMLYLFAAVFGLGYGGAVALMSPTIVELFGQSSLGVILGTLNFAGNVGGTVGPVLAGRIFDIFDSYQLAFSICVALGIIGIVLSLMLRPIRRRISAGMSD